MQLLPESGKNLRDFIQVRAEALQAANDSWYLDGISQGQGVIKMVFGVSVNHMNHHVSIWAVTLQWLHDVGISDFSWNASTEGIYTKEASLTPMTRKKSQADSFKRNKIYIYLDHLKDVFFLGCANFWAETKNPKNQNFQETIKITPSMDNSHPLCYFGDWNPIRSIPLPTIFPPYPLSHRLVASLFAPWLLLVVLG